MKMNMIHTQSYISEAKKIIDAELTSLNKLTHYINQDFDAACTYIMSCQGRVVVLGIGKSGHIGRKIAATLASTGTPAFFVHPAEASHGDLGMITPQDVVLAISYSGESQEINLLIPYLKQQKTPLIALCGNPNASLAKQANCLLQTTIDQEACPLGLAPTTSTTAALIMGDALAMVLLQAKSFSPNDFACKHPAGRLGKRLILRAKDIMHAQNIPTNNPSDTLKQTLITMSHSQFGITGIISPDDASLLGVFTDGDLRRCLNNECNLNTTLINDVMTPTPKTAQPHLLITELLQLMEHHKITAVFVINELQQPVGIIHMHDIIQSGII
jgi:arabinose-5-phosphate isomerase